MNYNIEHIKSYLNGALTETEKQAFQEQMADDITLQKEVEAYQTIFNGLNHLADDNFEEEVIQWSNSLRDKKLSLSLQNGKVKRSILFRRIAIAASIVLLAGFGLSWWSSQNYSNDALADQFYSAPLSTQTMGNNQDALLKPLHKLFEKAHEQYQNQEYQKASQTLNDLSAILKGNEQQMDALRFKFYKENVEWTSILTDLKLGRFTSSSEKLLSEIANNSKHGYNEQAKSLQNDLNSFWRSLGN